MKRQLGVAILLLGTACVAGAQDSAAPDTASATRNIAAQFSASPTETLTLVEAPSNAAWAGASNAFFAAQPAANPENAAADPAPAPSPDPRFLYGGRDDFRWQLAVGADWIRFRSSIFDASAVGVKTSVTYFTNDWFGVEGNVSAGFAPAIFQNDHVKILTYGVGPKIAWRERRWEPWAHAIFGGAHEVPQTSGNSKNAFEAELGGGADYRFNPRLSGRLEADWVHTTFFSQNQNNFELMGGVVFHF